MAPQTTPIKHIALAERELYERVNFKRGGLAVHERRFCERVAKFIEYVLPVEFPAQSEKACGLIFGTQTLTCVIEGKDKVVRDNFLVVSRLCDYAFETEMVVGNIKDKEKAANKVKTWTNEFSVAKKLKKVVAGPVSPEDLEDKVDAHFERSARGLVVLIMDSGGFANYSSAFKSLTKKYDNLYIIKMALFHRFDFKILRAYQGDVSTVNNGELESRYKLIKRKGWAWARSNPKEVLGRLLEKR